MFAFRFGKVLALILAAVLVLQLTACGTMIYPERRGQRSGNIDPAIAILDGVGLLFFIVPGLVAFAIDFATGAIYLPGGQKSHERVDQLRKKLGGRLDVDGDRLVLHLDPEQVTPEVIEAVVGAASGRAFRLDQDDILAYRLDSLSEMPMTFAFLGQGFLPIRLSAL